MATIRSGVRAVVNCLHNIYARLPAAAQTFLALAVFGLVAAAQGFNWAIPTTGAQFNVELAALAALAYGVVVPLFQVYIQPYLIGWMIEALRIIPVVDTKPVMARASRYGNLPRAVILWRAA